MKRLIFLLLLLGAGQAQAERIKDIASIAGVRSNQLVGYGLVTGLDKSGDKTKFTGQSLRSMMGKLGMTLPPDIDPKSKNVALVSVHADLPAFAKPGQKIDVTVSSMGDAKSLRGGSLLMSPLRGADGNVYAVAQGNLVVGGLSAGGQDGSKVTVNNPLVGRIPSGATVERIVPTSFDQSPDMVFNLNTADFTTAQRMADSINKTLGADTAQTIDATSVSVRAPVNPAQRVGFASVIENIELAPDDAPAKVIVNSRTGTVIINSKVRVQPAAVSHGSLTVTISENPQVSQPNPLSGGSTVVTPQSNVEVKEDKNHMFVFNPGVSLDEIVQAVNGVGAGPSDLVAILEALRSAGALRAELIVI
ncbi:MULTISPECIES: flagellar basal body P-ring protein FlgI [Methylomonas]|uniref:Flagellar P-ring protein n=1 Tax=Methylomonas koyamae TaxID=702114 RepID=A0A177NPI5_9GAMM|nr:MULTISPECIES: flagellar basal body P-ring protein FlgI [Methylomonas]ANE56921.1 flagellar biosynthesis protein FlgI [Methylomonas sp. DH-1]ATG91876.1 flagellar P-ring protein precursor FlgI [Methylomonas koyamae]OAI18950.1 flagellar biosynthesis protein FlgI [Methylomonas koyamae]OAI28861.1 flagellar biosynthesis protein FlgI [Methylomonas koyamae]WNB75316.1 flagellar basal body P-ring protein FlgI [Methylomonas koyamae]